MTYGPPSPYGPPPAFGPSPVFTPAPVIRPSLGWVAAAWGVAVVLGAAAFVYGVVGVVTTTADRVLGTAPTSTFSSGQTVTVSLDPADGPGVYSDGYPQDATCEVGGGTVGPVSAGSEISLDSGTLWDREFDLKVPAKGEYKVTCTSEGYTGRFGVGTSSVARSDELSATNTGYAVVMIGLPLAFLVLAGVVNIVIVVRRGHYRRALGR